MLGVLGLFTLAGCGGSSDSSAGNGGGNGGGTGNPPAATQTGQLLDEVVQGASYYTSTGSGGCTASAPCTTDADGRFGFAPGDTVTVGALGVRLGTVALTGASDGGVTLVRPNTLTGESDPAGPKAINVAKFLHMISTQTQAGIQVNSSLGSLAAAVPNADATEISDFTVLQETIRQSSGVTVSIPRDSDIESILTQTATLTPATVTFDGSIWRATCDPGCGGGTFTLKSTGEVLGFTDEGNLISGAWSVNPDGSVALNLVSSGGGSATGALPAGQTSCAGCVQFADTTDTLSLTQISSATNAVSVYAGLWYAGFTPNSQGTLAGLQPGGAIVVAAPDAKVYGMTDGGEFFSGDWTFADGQGTAMVAATNSTSQIVNFDLAKLTGTLNVNGTIYGDLVFDRANGTSTAPYFVLHSSSGNPIPLLLNLEIDWKNAGGSGSGGYSESLALDAHVDDSSGNRLASAIKAEHTYILFGTVTIPPTTDTIALSYPQGAGVSYHVTFGNGQASMTDAGGMTCSIANGDGTVNDAYQGDPSNYPTVRVNCN